MAISRVAVCEGSSLHTPDSTPVAIQVAGVLTVHSHWWTWAGSTSALYAIKTKFKAEKTAKTKSVFLRLERRTTF